MDANYDMGKLNFGEMLELRELQAKMQDETAAQEWPRRAGQPVEFARLTLDELLALERLYTKMAGLPPREPPAPYVPVIANWDKPASSGVTAASSSAPAEPVAIAPAAAPAKPVAPATQAPAATLKRPAEDVVSAERQLGALMRFGV